MRAVDRNRGMIERVWPGPESSVMCASWLDMDMPDASRDLVLCDGGLHLLGYPGEQDALLRKLRNILAPGGLVVFRLFVPPNPPESPSSVVSQLSGGKIRDLNILKLKMAMAMQESPEAGVELHQIWRAMNDFEPDMDRLAGILKRPVEHVMAINAYRESASRYHFVSVDQARDLFSHCGFVCRHEWYADYEFGTRCPVLVMERMN